MKNSNPKISYQLIIACLCSFLIFESCSKDEDISAPISAYVEIPDPSFESILIDLDIDSDGLVNQQMSTRDAERIIRLDLRNSIYDDIEDLTGIEAFKNLKSLNVTRHSLEQIDLSSNTELDTLTLEANRLKNIDLSNNIKLVLVDISYNDLTALDGLSALPNLKRLNLSGNLFEEIQIGNPDLETLLMTDNELTSIDVTGALNITSILLNRNKINTFDISSNVKLETLLLSGNHLETIDLSQNQDLAYLYISSNHLNSLDVSNNLALVDLRVDRNPSLDCIKIGNGQEIPTLSISNQQELNTSCNQ